MAAAPPSPADDDVTLTFGGNATTLLRIGGFTLLTDPNFLRRGQRAYLGKGLWSRRLTDPALMPDELPDLDAVVLSHLHGDHFDRVARAGLSRSQPVFTTPPAARRLSDWGFATEGMETWDSTTLSKAGETLALTSLPAVHARGVLGALLPPVMGTLLEHRSPTGILRVYLSGDTLMGEHIEEIARRHPDIDVAVVHLGGTRVLLHTVTMDARQGVEFVRSINPTRTVPVHYDDYKVFRSPLVDFLSRARESGIDSEIQRVGRGETVVLPTHRPG